MNALDYDDTAAVSGHPGAPILAAALAVAQEQGSSGTQLLEAVLAGYETAARVAAACRPSHAQYELVHGSQSFMGFGTCAAVGRLLKLDLDGMRRAFGIVGALSPIPVAGKFGWDEEQLSWIKDNVNWPAEAGVRAGHLAAAGFPASGTILDGDKGFWRMVASDHCDPTLFGEPDRFYTRDLALKPYPCCRWLHSSLDAFLEAYVCAQSPKVEEIRHVQISTTLSVARSFGSNSPSTMVDAQFSAPHAISALCHGYPFHLWWESDTRTSPSAMSMMNKVFVLEDRQMTTEFLSSGRNVNRIPARVIIELQNGLVFEASCTVPGGTPGEHSGDYEHLLFARKHQNLLGSRYQPDAVTRLTEALEQLPSAPDLNELTAALLDINEVNSCPALPLEVTDDE
jgi:2-methylcitrate dehydratase PrpD